MANIYTNFDPSKLEFDHILQQIKQFTLSEKAKEIILNTVPITDHKLITKDFTLLEQLKLFLINDGSLKINVIYDFEKQINDSKKDIVIDAKELFELSFSVKNYFVLKKAFNNEEYPLLNGSLTINKIENNFHQEILKYIDQDGNISSNASSELKKIRNRISELEIKIEKATEVFFKSAKAQKYISDDIISLRDGFLCIAVRASHKNKLDGIVMDSSNTGQTVYIAPKTAINLHNELRSTQDEEKREIYKILKKYTEIIKEHSDLLSIINTELLTFDIIYAKTKFALQFNLNIPEISNTANKSINIVEGKHPLLGKKAIPLNLKMDKDLKIVIITGPNTGGKTVVLKTIGLFTLMVQSSIPIPASSSSVFSIYNKVFIDIGDEQSIEESLSTFSAHIIKIKDIIERTNKNSLILIDEFGAGTDPSEGSALAIGILNKLLVSASIAIMTTHYSALKHYAAQEHGIENASMRFDAENLMPTYELQMGLPGSSKGLDIAMRLGLPKDIINDAKKNLNEDYINIEKLVKKLEDDKLQIEKIKKSIKAKEREAETNNETLSKQLREIERKEKLLNDRYKEQETIFLKDSRKDFEKIIKEIRTDNASKDSIKKGKELFEKIEHEIKKKDKKTEKISKIFNKGDDVLVISKQVNGTILEKTNNPDEYLVQVGIIKVNFPSHDLQHVKTKKINKAPVTIKKPSIESIITLDLRGYRFEEAENAMDKFIDNSIASNTDIIKIIHGIGTGALKKCIQDYCQRSPYVIDYDFEKDPASSATNYGVTIARLRIN